MTPEHLIVHQQPAPHVAHVQLHWPKELNALNLELMGELRDVLRQLDADDQVRAIVISGDVEIGDVIVTHKNVVVDATAVPSFTKVDIDESKEPKLDQLVNQLNALKVPTSDVIEIIRGIERNGKLHGRLIIE